MDVTEEIYIYYSKYSYRCGMVSGMTLAKDVAGCL